MAHRPLTISARLESKGTLAKTRAYAPCDDSTGICSDHASRIHPPAVPEPRYQQSAHCWGEKVGREEDRGYARRVFRRLLIFVLILVLLRRFTGIQVSILGSLLLTFVVSVIMSRLDR